MARRPTSSIPGGPSPVRVDAVQSQRRGCWVEGTPGAVIVRVTQRDSVAKGDVIHVTTDPRGVHVFDTESGARLSD